MSDVIDLRTKCLERNLTQLREKVAAQPYVLIIWAPAQDCVYWEEMGFEVNSQSECETWVEMTRRVSR